MSAKDKTLATFQIDKSKWSKFKRLTGNQSASAVLVQFIEKFLDNPHILEQSSYGETSNIEYQSITDSRIKALEDRLSVIEAYNKESESNLARESISNLENKYKELEKKLSVLENSNPDSVINSARKSIINLEVRCKDLQDRLSIIESSNHQSVNNSIIKSINNLESKSQELEQKLLKHLEVSKQDIKDTPQNNYISSIEAKVKAGIEERDNKVREALEQAELELGTSAQKKVLRERAAELLNEWEVLDKSGNQGKWTWTKVRNYFKK